MKKMIVAALVIASMTLAACGKKTTTPAKPDPGSAAPAEGSGSAAPTEGSGSGEAPPAGG